jgi:DNA-binding PadR family transcriptional regulator
MLHELREHGYTVRPGTLYPLLHRMEKQDKRAGLKARREHFLTAASREALKEVLSYLTTDIDTDRGRTLETRLISVSS